MMSTWILILTISAYTSQTGVAIHSIAGFESRAGCLTAANAWLSTSRQPTNIGQTHTALCVEQQKARQ